MENTFSHPSLRTWILSMHPLGEVYGFQVKDPWTPSHTVLANKQKLAT